MTAGCARAPLPRLAVALDAPGLEPLEPILDELAGLPILAKVGPALFTAVGPSVVHHLRAAGFEVFLDLQLHDLPSQISTAVTVASRLDAALLSIHAAAGRQALQAAVAARRPGLRLCATAVTSGLAAAELGGETALAALLAERIALCAQAGLDGVLLAAGDLAAAAHVAPQLARLATAVRPAGAVAGEDQARWASVGTALAGGAAVLVVGRPVLQARQPRAVAEALLHDIDRLATVARIP